MFLSAVWSVLCDVPFCASWYTLTYRLNTSLGRLFSSGRHSIINTSSFWPTPWRPLELRHQHLFPPSTTQTKKEQWCLSNKQAGHDQIFQSDWNNNIHVTILTFTSKLALSTKVRGCGPPSSNSSSIWQAAGRSSTNKSVMKRQLHITKVNTVKNQQQAWEMTALYGFFW